MFQRALTHEEFANHLCEDIVILGRADAGPISVLTAEHPIIGRCAILQDTSPGMIIFSEAPFDSLFDCSLAA